MRDYQRAYPGRGLRLVYAWNDFDYEPRLVQGFECTNGPSGELLFDMLWIPQLGVSTAQWADTEERAKAMASARAFVEAAKAEERVSYLKHRIFELGGSRV